jgi:hypothetical protein
MRTLVFHSLIHVLVIFFILLLAFSPFIGAMAAGTIANAYGCQLDEGSIHPCMVNGRDIGQTLYTFGVLGWLGLATIPIGLVVLGIYLVIVILFYLVRWYRRNRVGQQAFS